MVPLFEPDGEIVQRGIPDDGPRFDRRTFMKGAGTAAAGSALAGCSNPVQQSQGNGNSGSKGGDIPGEPLKMAVVGFTSGPASVFGVPTMNAAQMVVEQINSQGGILGKRKIELTKVDENADQIAQQYRRLATQQNMDIIIGYISSANILTIAPIAEQLGQPTIVWDAGTNALFEKKIKRPKWTFRTAAHLSIDAIGAAQLLATSLPDVKTVAGVNQDYAWGRDNWAMFSQALKQLAPNIRITSSRFTPFGSSEYSSTISALVSEEPDFIYSSLWGGDLISFINQASNQGLFDVSLPCFSTGVHAFGVVPDQIPAGIMFGARGPHFPLGVYEDNPLQRRFTRNYRQQFGSPPFTHGTYHAWQAIHFYVSAIERYYKAIGQYPDDETLMNTMEHSGLYTPSGFVQLARAGGHQAIESSFYGFSSKRQGSKYPELADPVWIAPEQVNPPVGLTTSEWISSFPEP